MGDFIKCPRAYYLHNVYKSPDTGRKIGIVNQFLSLGSAVHEVLENLAKYKAEDRFKQPLTMALEKAWQNVSGKKGGFVDNSEEEEIKKRALEMIQRVEKNPGPLIEKTIKIKESEGGMPPNFLLSKEENIILCGKIDWLVYKPQDDSVHILDFKTGKNDEREGSLQLPIYQLLLKNLQKRKVSGASYWYIDRDDKPKDVELPDIDESFENVYSIAKKIKEMRELSKIEGAENVFLCPNGENGCSTCKPYLKIIRGEAECVGVNNTGQDLFIV